jgi:hypothetical protein
VKTNTRPQKGKGERWFDCKYYEDCLDLAALRNWHSFNCTRCPLYNHVFEEREMNMETNKSNTRPQTRAPEKKEENRRMCAECGQRVTISPSSPLCAHCMAIKANQAKKKRPQDRFKSTDPTPSIGQAKKTQYRGNTEFNEKAQDKTSLVKPTITIEKPQSKQDSGTMALTIQFNGYATILDGIKRIAEYEMRPLEMQVIYILKEYVRANEVNKSI